MRRVALGLVVCAAACGRASPAVPVRPTPAVATVAAPQVDPFHDLLVPRALCQVAASATVSRADALADLETVERILRRGYAGFEPTALRGVNWDRDLAALHPALATLPDPITTDDLRRWLAARLAVTDDDLLGTFTPSGHDRQWIPAGVHHAAYTVDLVIGEAHTVVAASDRSLLGLDFDACAEMPLEQTVSDTSVKPQRRPILVTATPPTSVVCTLSRTGADDEAVEVKVTLPVRRLHIGPADPGPAFERVPRMTPVLRVRDFGAPWPALEEFGYTSSALFSAPVIVLDLRGNRTGDDSDVAYWAHSLLGQQIKPPSRHELTSEVTDQGKLNRLTCTPPRPQPADPKAVEEVNRQNQELTDELEGARKAVEARAAARQLERTWAPERRSMMIRVGGRLPETKYAGVLIVVVDAACGAGCEGAVNYARQLPRSLVIGENTSGAGEYGDGGRYRLPRTGIWLQVGAEWRRPAARGGTGYEPDVWLDTNNVGAVIDHVAACAASDACYRSLANH